MSTAGKNLYAVLGLTEKAGPEELRKAYLNLAVKYHPDRNPGDPAAEERFKDISQAYAILSDPTAKAKYERLRPRKAARPGTRPAGGVNSASAGAKARPSAAASARPSPGAKGGGASASSARTESSAQSGAGAAASSAKDSSADTRQKNADASSSAQANAKSEATDNDFDEVLSGFFKTDKGRETLRDLEGELGRAGIKFKAEDFAEWVRQKQNPPKQAAADKRSFMERLASWLPGAESRAQKKAAHYDIAYQITLSPQAAASGTTVEISYQEDQGPQRLAVKIPAGIRDGAKLRLGGQGRLKPDQSRGDLILSVLVSQPLTISDLWK